MFSHNNYSVFMISMRVGKQGIPLWFRCFKGKDNSDAFKESLILEGINYVIDLFDKSFKLIFLADRWFNSINIMKTIDDAGHIFCLRLKKNIKAFVYDKKEGVKVNIKMYKKLKIKMYNFYIDSDSSESNFILFLILYELPFILII